MPPRIVTVGSTPARSPEPRSTYAFAVQTPGDPAATARAGSDVRDELSAREPLFHRAEWGTRQADFRAMITDDYWEIGASGQVYGREHVLQVLRDRHSAPVEDPWQVEDFACHRLADDLFQATYTLWQRERQTRRSTLWRRTADGWRAVFHQGTVVQPVGPLT